MSSAVPGALYNLFISSMLYMVSPGPFLEEQCEHQTAHECCQLQRNNDAEVQRFAGRNQQNVPGL